MLITERMLGTAIGEAGGVIGRLIALVSRFHKLSPSFGVTLWSVEQEDALNSIGRLNSDLALACLE